MDLVQSSHLEAPTLKISALGKQNLLRYARSKLTSYSIFVIFAISFSSLNTFYTKNLL